MDVNKIVKFLNEGKIGITPTDTVYGIMGDATNEEVIKKVYKVKKRDYSKPLLILVSNIKMLEEYVNISNDLERTIIEKFWPGKLTIIMKKKNNLSNLITGGSDTIGVRMPDNKDLIKIIELFGKPIISTSANISGSETIEDVSEIEEELKDNVDFIVDGGRCIARSSTIISILDNKINILRNGELSSKLEEFNKDL